MAGINFRTANLNYLGFKDFSLNTPTLWIALWIEIMAKGSNRLTAGHLKKKGPTKEGWLFPFRQKGKHLSNIAMLKSLKEDLGYKNFTVHGFVPHSGTGVQKKPHPPGN